MGTEQRMHLLLIIIRCLLGYFWVSVRTARGQLSPAPVRASCILAQSGGPAPEFPSVGWMKVCPVLARFSGPPERNVLTPASGYRCGGEWFLGVPLSSVNSFSRC